MRVLLDECVPVQLRHRLSRHETSTVEYAGWRGLPDTELISRAEALFDVLVTCDASMPHQYSLAGRRLAIVVVPTNRRKQVEFLAERIAAAIDNARPGEFQTLELST
jgi:predicted nuclease of predicted toxin-antitoxin system